MTGLSLVAIRQSLVMKPDWIELTGEGREAEIAIVPNQYMCRSWRSRTGCGI